MINKLFVVPLIFILAVSGFPLSDKPEIVKQKSRIISFGAVEPKPVHPHWTNRPRLTIKKPRHRPRRVIRLLTRSDDFGRLRQCESTNDYTNRNSPFYGAYQFDLKTWHGLGYFGNPANASPSVQDKAAHKLQSQRGWQPWPACSRKLGLG